jgi:hypothetical protein
LVTPNAEQPPAAGFLEKSKAYRLSLTKAGALGAEIIRHVREQRNVAFVVIDSLRAGAASPPEPWL